VLPPGEYLIVAGHPAHAPGQAFVETTGEDPAEVTIALRPGQRLDGRVVDGAGQPVARAEITAQPAATEEYELVPPVTVWSGNDGAFAFFGLDDEDVTVWATHQLGRSDPALLALPAGSPVVLTIAGEGRARVRGTVRFDDGGAPDEIEVGGPFERVTLREASGAFATSVGAHDQYFTIRGPDFEDETVPLEGLEPGEERDLGVITVRRGRAVRGTLVEADGAPRAGIEVTVGTMLDSFDRWATRSGSSGADGVFVIRGLPSAPLALRVEWPGGFAGHLPIDIPAGDADVDLGVIGERDTVNPLVEELTRDLREALEEGTRKP
jgi:hypothetical protein